MALQKEIQLENGVTLNYHRITSFNKITNIVINIEISSYTSKEQREKERAYQTLQLKSANEIELTEEEQLALANGLNIFIETEYIQIPYDEDMNIENAYDYIKTIKKYENAKDV